MGIKNLGVWETKHQGLSMQYCSGMKKIKGGLDGREEGMKKKATKAVSKSEI